MMAPVSVTKYGRRAGQTRSAEPPGDMLQGGSRSGMTLPDGTDLRRVKILSKADFERIQYNLNKQAILLEEERRRNEEKEDLRDKSKQMWKNWTNTIAGARQKKLQERRLREEIEEEKRKEIDLEEAQYQAAKRKEALEKAKIKQYYKTDRVKQFHSALQLTEVLKERDAQLDLAKLKAQAFDQDHDINENMKLLKEEQYKREAEEHQKRVVAAKNTSQFHQKQIEENARRRRFEEEERRIESDKIADLAKQFQEEKAKLEEVNALEKKELMEDYARQLSAKNKIQRLEKLHEEHEDEECLNFANAKRKLMKLRREKEHQIYNAKMEQLNRICDKLSSQLKLKTSDEKERLEKAISEKETRYNDEMRDKEAKHLEMTKAINEHRLNKMRAAEEEKARQKEMDEMMLAKDREMDKLFLDHEAEKWKRKRLENQELSKYHLSQQENRQQEEERARHIEDIQHARNQEMNKLEERQFQQYASRVIHHQTQAGRNIYPLEKARQSGIGGGAGPLFEGFGIRPSYKSSDEKTQELPHWKRGSTEETKQLIGAHHPTDRRLGFTYTGPAT